MSLKIAISGKGGVGKTTLAATLARLLGGREKRVVLVDCDPAPNLAIALGIDDEDRSNIVPLCNMSDLIAERTGVEPGRSQGKMYTLNPQVDDILERFGVEGADNVTLLVLGAIRHGGTGCFCPESALLKRLLNHLTKREEILILDMEAGVEHLGRGTTRNIDLLLIVVEPGLRSVETARQIKRLGEDIGIERFAAVMNKAHSPAAVTRIERAVAQFDLPLIGVLPFLDAIVEADLNGHSIGVDARAEAYIAAVDALIGSLV